MKENIYTYMVEKREGKIRTGEVLKFVLMAYFLILFMDNYTYLKGIKIDVVVNIIVFLYLIITRRVEFKKIELFIIGLVLLYILLPLSDGIVLPLEIYIKYFLYFFNDYLIIKNIFTLLRINREFMNEAAIPALFIFLFLNIMIGIIEVTTSKHLYLGDPSRYMPKRLNVPQGFFINTNDFSIFLVMVQPLVMKYFSKRLFLLSQILVIALIILSGSVISLISYIILIFYCLYAIINSKSRMWGLLYLILIIIFLCIGIFMKEYNIDLYSKLSSIESSWVLRKEVYQFYFDLLKSCPWGFGIKAIEIWETKIFTNPHSLFFELYLYLGIFGASFIYTIVIVFAIYYWISTNELYSKIFMFDVILYFLVGNFATSQVLYGVNSIVIILVIMFQYSKELLLERNSIIIHGKAQKLRKIFKT